MFDAFKRLIRGDDDEPIPEEPKALGAPKRRGAGPDKLQLTGAGSMAIPDQESTAGQSSPSGSAAPTGGGLPAPTAPMVREPQRQQVQTMTLGLRDLMRAKPMQHFILLADGLETVEKYRFHQIGGRFYEIIKPTFPAVDTFTTITFWGFNFQGDHSVNIRVMNLDDVVIAELAQAYTFRLERASDSHETRTTWQVLFPEPGTYHIVVETDGRPTAVAPIFVSRGGG